MEAGRGSTWDDLERYPSRVWHGIVLVLSLAFAVWFRLIWPSEWLYDDGAIVLRYMDKFAQGGFFQYNLEDPPVFGISGFLHGILAGMLSASHVLSSQNSILFSNTIGVALVSATTLMILRVYSTSAISILLGWLLTLSASHYFVVTAFQGLETPLHLGLVLLAFWAFLTMRSRTMWCCFAIAVISKLDAAPVVAVLGLLRLVEVVASRGGRRAWRQEMRNAAIWAGVPLLVWVGFTMWLFGSPLPQSAYAKVVYHGHPESRLAFLGEWWRIDEHLIWRHAAVALLLPLSCLFRGPALGASRTAALGLPLGCVALVVLYSYYNPGERMPWYYALPQYLLFLAAVITVLDLLVRLRGRWRWAGPGLAALVFAMLAPNYFATSLESARYVTEHILRSEPERAAVGAFVRDNAAPGDRIYTGHGYTARNAEIYAIDYSGLNSPVVTDLRRQNKGPIVELAPEWSVRPGLWGADFQESERYELQASFFGRAFDDRDSWRIFRRRARECGPVTVADPLTEDEVQADGGIRTPRQGVIHVRGITEALFSSRRSGRIVELRVGVARISEQQIFEFQVVREGHGNIDLGQTVVPPIDPRDPATGRSEELRVAIPENGPAGTGLNVRIKRVGEPTSGQPFRLFEPVWMIATSPRSETH